MQNREIGLPDEVQTGEIPKKRPLTAFLAVIASDINLPQ